MNILVTGGAGFIGSHTLIELYKAGHTALVVDNLYNAKAEALHRVEEILNSQFSTLNSQFSTLNSQFSILNSQFSILNSQFSILNSQLPLPAVRCFPANCFRLRGGLRILWTAGSRWSVLR